MKNAILMTAIGMATAVPAVADNSGAFINQLFGIGNVAAIEQNAALNSSAHIWQDGINNVAGHAVVQDSGNWFIDNPGILQQMSTNAHADITQVGDRNEGNIFQIQSTNAHATIYQSFECGLGCEPGSSDDNKALIEQFGFDNLSRIRQTAGSFNDAATYQDGTGGLLNVADIIQGGMRNYARINQIGAGHQAFIRQR